jgi:hypothetical protein
MAFTIIRPEYLDDFIDITKPEEANRFRIIMNPHTVDYVVLLNRADAVKRIMSYEEPVKFYATNVDDTQSKVFEENAAAKIAEFPYMKYFGQIRYMFMNTLTRKGVTLDRSLLILNYAITTIQGMINQFKQDLIPGYCGQLTNLTDVSEILKTFDKMPVNPQYSLAAGLMILRNLKDSKDLKRVMTRAYSGLGISGPEALTAADIPRFYDRRAEFAKKYQDERPHIFQNLMVNYMWELVTPFTVPTSTLWENYVYYILIFNALKMLITLTSPKDDDEFAEIVAVFDRALIASEEEGNFFAATMRAAKQQGFDGNGDLGIVTIS